MSFNVDTNNRQTAHEYAYSSLALFRPYAWRACAAEEREREIVMSNARHFMNTTHIIQQWGACMVNRDRRSFYVATCIKVCKLLNNKIAAFTMVCDHSFNHCNCKFMPFEIMLCRFLICNQFINSFDIQLISDWMQSSMYL